MGQATLPMMENYCSVSGESINLEKFVVHFGKEADVRIQKRISRFMIVRTGNDF